MWKERKEEKQKKILTPFFWLSSFFFSSLQFFKTKFFSHSVAVENSEKSDDLASGKSYSAYMRTVCETLAGRGALISTPRA